MLGDGAAADLVAAATAVANVTRSLAESCCAALLLRFILVIMQFLDNFPVITRTAMLTKQALNKHLSK